MKALISPLENYRICQVEENDFPVAEPLFWTDCPNNCDTQWFYENGAFISPVDIIPTAEQNKETAVQLLSQTDWTTISDIGNPEMSNPYLENQAEFIAWRSQVRA